MEKENKKEKCTYQRTSNEQLEYYLHFIEENPGIQANKNNPTQPRLVEDLWEVLSKKLNALKGPTRTRQKWKETLNHWKNQVRSRARKIKTSNYKTGGGPPTNIGLNQLEQRALKTFGAIAVNCHCDLPVLGMEMDVENAEDVVDLFDEHASITESSFSESCTSHPLPDLSSYISVDNALPSSSLSSSRSRSLTVDKMFDKVCEIIKHRDEKEKSVLEVISQQQLQISETLRQLAQLIQDLKK